MNWSQELVTSLVWLIKAFLISGTGFVIVFGVILYSTQIGKDFRRLSGDYFSWKTGSKPLLLLAAVIIFALINVRISVVISQVSSNLYTSLQELNSVAFWSATIAFFILAMLRVLRVLISYYLKNNLEINWRISLTHKLMDMWLNKQSYFVSNYASNKMDNPDQRIQQDVDSFITLSVKLSVGLLEAAVTLFEFTIMLWMLSGALSLFGLEIPRAMVILAYVYVIIATLIAIYLGRPLIQLNFLNEKFNASFRYALIRLREYGESIAFYRGEKPEKNRLANRFKDVIANSWAIVFRSIKFDGFNIVANLTASVFPLIIQAPRLFAKEIKLGDMMQSARAFNEVEESLAYFRLSYDSFASYRAVIIRLIGYLDVVDEAETLSRLTPNYEGKLFRLHNVHLKSPDGQTLVNGLSLNLAPSQALIIQGTSGVGKTSLLRAIAGLWPFAQGDVTLPMQAATLFLPQKPYLPIGTLAEAVSYPHTDIDDKNIIDVLAKVQLAHLSSKIHIEDDWTNILSLGEQQRLAIGRAIISNPQVLFLDEASSAMDEGLEFAMYSLLKEALPQSIFISVGHRSSLLAFHDEVLELKGNGDWDLRKAK